LNEGIRLKKGMDASKRQRISGVAIGELTTYFNFPYREIY
jgi:hypothetical protein